MRILSIFNIKFIDAHAYEIIDEIKNGAFITAPAAPALAMIKDNKKYLASLRGSDFAIFDSGFLCICLLILKGIKVKKLSGLSLIRLFLKNIKRDLTKCDFKAIKTRIFVIYKLKSIIINLIKKRY